MNFALLGAEPDILPLLEAIRGSSQHALVAAYETPDAPELALSESFGVFPSDDGWESLLLGSVCDAVIVCRCKDEDRRADQLRKLIQAAIPLIIVHPVGSAILAFELQMIGEDSGGIIVPYQPGLDHPVIQELRGTTTEPTASDAPIKQVSIERRMSDTATVAVGQQFARDALMIRQLVGRIDQVAALRSSPDETDDANLSVQMSAENGCIVRWTVLPASEVTATQWKVHTEKRTTTAMMPNNGEWTVTGRELTTGGDSASNWQVAHITLDRLAGRQAGRTMSGPDWDEACRAVELRENVDISKRRGKTIQLHYEDISEENTFKSLMTAGGCLILILIVLLLPMLAAVETLLRPTSIRTDVAEIDESAVAESPSSSSPFLRTSPINTEELSWFRVWPIVLFCFLAFFLCMQLLRLAAKSAKSRVEKSAPPAPPK